MTPKNRTIRCIRPSQLLDSIAGFDPKNATTRGEFSIDVPGFSKDIEWNHMDQLHRQAVHHTYQDNLRIAVGRDFATSLTRWGRWPFFITVADVRVDEGVFYQEIVLAGVIFVHNTITMVEKDEMVHLRNEWIISSHRFLKPVHSLLDRMFYKLNARLQVEDAVIRSQRYRMRKKGYSFLSDPPDYLSSNMLTNNTVYPPLPENAVIALDGLPTQVVTPVTLGNIEFLVRRDEDAVLLWPSACPHEGGELAKGELHDNCQMECPWHGLKFSAARLTVREPAAEAYGFRYTLNGNVVSIQRG